MRKLITSVLSASVILGAVGLGATSAQEPTKLASLPTSPIIDSSGGSISIQADRQEATVNKQTYNPGGARYSGEVNGRNRVGHYYLSYVEGGSQVDALLLEYNGSSWVEVDRISTNVTLYEPNVSGSYYMKNGYSYKLKLLAYANDAAVARVTNY